MGDSFDLDEIDQACREIEDEVATREKRKRGKGSESIKNNCETLKNKETTASVIKDSATERPSVEESSVKRIETEKERSQDWIMKSVEVVIEHLNKFGACVID